MNKGLVLSDDEWSAFGERVRSIKGRFKDAYLEVSSHVFGPYTYAHDYSLLNAAFTDLCYVLTLAVCDAYPLDKQELSDGTDMNFVFFLKAYKSEKTNQLSSIEERPLTKGEWEACRQSLLELDLLVRDPKVVALVSEKKRGSIQFLITRILSFADEKK